VDSVVAVSSILDVDLLAFESSTGAARRAVVDGVRRSLETGFVYTSHDLPEDLLDTAYGMLADFFSLEPEVKQRFTVPGVNGQTGYTGLLVETAASSDRPDWKEMLNWSVTPPAGHPLRRRFPGSYPDQVLPEEVVPGITEVLGRFHRAIDDLQRRFLRVIAEGIGCHESFFDEMVADGPTLTRAIRYPSMEGAPGDGHVWAGAHGDINLITALPRATAPGLQVMVDDVWVDAAPLDGAVIINTGIMLERLTNGVIPIGWHRVVAHPDFVGERYSVVQFCHPRPWTVLSPLPSCCSEDRPQRYSAITAADALDEVIFQINLVEDARRVEG
jgi:isopenicillin N synthase-like dioxygenase